MSPSEGPPTPRPPEHWGSVVKATAPRIVIDTARSRWGTWGTLVLTHPWVAPWTHLRPIHCRDRARAEAVHREVAHWVLDLDAAVSCDPEVCNGRPVVRGTRVWVDQVLALVSVDGELDWQAVHEAYPRVPREAAEALARLPGHVRRTIEEMCR